MLYRLADQGQWIVKNYTGKEFLDQIFRLRNNEPLSAQPLGANLLAQKAQVELLETITIRY